MQAIYQDPKKSEKLTPKAAVSKYKARALEVPGTDVEYRCWVAIYIIANGTPGMESTKIQAMTKISKLEKRFKRDN